MDIEAIAKTMKARMPWDTARRVFDSGEIKKAHGWENTVRKLVETSAGDKTAINYLSAALKEHILCGEKLSRFYRLTRKDMSLVRNAAVELDPKDSAFLKAYPSAMSETQIEESFPQEHTIVAVETNKDGVGVVFASTRAMEVRQPIDLAELPESTAEALDRYDEVLGVRLLKFQAMDVVWIPHNGSFIDVRVDFPRGMHRDTAAATHQTVRDTFAKLTKSTHLTTPINLFPLIGKIYDDPNEGNVVELAFGTTTASLKHEKMRRSSACLRKEKYHKGGKQALNAPIEPYRA
jgi:hypothetical protein